MGGRGAVSVRWISACVASFLQSLFRVMCVRGALSSQEGRRGQRGHALVSVKCTAHTFTCTQSALHHRPAPPYLRSSTRSCFPSTRMWPLKWKVCMRFDARTSTPLYSGCLILSSLPPPPPSYPPPLLLLPPPPFSPSFLSLCPPLPPSSFLHLKESFAAEWLLCLGSRGLPMHLTTRVVDIVLGTALLLRRLRSGWCCARRSALGSRSEDPQPLRVGHLVAILLLKKKKKKKEKKHYEWATGNVNGCCGVSAACRKLPFFVPCFV